tara:strand:+ start:331 stop:558 length:228 start_codon:yes stop_codon:yes gene_type:complete
MHNPFSSNWNKKWSFKIVDIEGGIYIENGLKILIRKPLLATESSFTAAYKLFILKIKIEELYSTLGSQKGISSFK